jgi:hypothetical protein
LICSARTITVEQAARIPIQLQITPLLTLSNKKLISLGKKYFSIPPWNLPYYIEIPLTLHAQLDQTEQNQEQALMTCQNKRQRLTVNATGESMPMMVKARPGRLKKVKMVEVKPSQKSIMCYFSPKP